MSMVSSLCPLNLEGAQVLSVHYHHDVLRLELMVVEKDI